MTDAPSPLMQGDVCNSRLERFLKGFGFSLLCFGIWAALSGLRARTLARDFSWIGLIFLTYNAGIAIMFLARTRPTIVTMDPVHWIVALLASFAGLFFEKTSTPVLYADGLGDALILGGVGVSGISLIALGRSYDFLPALRGVSTGWFYAVVRHPMYVGSIVIRLGYVLKHVSVYNVVIFAVMVLLYDRRCMYEEQIMRNDAGYRNYAARVRYRFVPGLR